MTLVPNPLAGAVFFLRTCAYRRSIFWAMKAEGFGQVMQGFDYTRALIGLQCVGPALASLDETWEYIQQRETFGAPLSSYQGVTFPLAEWETQVSAARLLCYDALDRRGPG